MTCRIAALAVAGHRGRAGFRDRATSDLGVGALQGFVDALRTS